MSYALVTGASKGIGKEIARELAKKKYDLFLVARSENLLADLAVTLSKDYGIKCSYVAADLTTESGIEKVVSSFLDLKSELNILVNNAGYGLLGNFAEMPFSETNSLIKININLPLSLTYKLIPELNKSKQAYILNIASTAAYQAVPKLSVYAACKAFMLTFSRGLSYELRNTTISVTCVSPGTTETNFMDAAGMFSETIRKKAAKVSMSPQSVAAFAVKSMFKKKVEAIPGWINKISVALIPFSPKALTEKIAAGIYEK